ncbi:MAG TPA: LCP family protein [Thermoflexales bacterium]|nr:LCP family protein [Thermoflexales bacterium]
MKKVFRRRSVVSFMLMALLLCAALPPHQALAQTTRPPNQVASAEPTAIPIPPPIAALKLPPGTFTIALLGIDKRPTRNFQNTDVIMLAAINPDVPAVTVLSIPRDTNVYIPGAGVMKVNQAYAIGGWALFKKTMAYNFGLTPDNYAMVNFEGLVKAVDVLGGVDVIASCPINHVFPRDPYYMGGFVTPTNYKDTFTGEIWKAGTKIPLLTLDLPKPGLYHLDGLHALAFVRARKGIPLGDVDRVRREQRTVRALFAKAKDTGSLLKIPELFAQMKKYITTDLTLDRIVQLAGLADKFSDLNIRSRFLEQTDQAGEAVINNADGSYFGNRRQYLQDTFTFSLNQRPNDGIPVEVWNGTDDAGFAIAAADRLRELGFRVVDLKPADKPYKESAIVDFNTTAKGSAISLLTRTFDIDPKNVTKTPQSDGPRYRVIVGPDFNPCYYSKSLQASGSETVDPGLTDSEIPSSVDFIQPITPTVTLVPPTPTMKPIPTTTPIPPTATPVLPTPQATPAPASAAVTLAVPEGDLVNARKGPGVQYEIVTRIGPGNAYPVTARSAPAGWLQIQVDGAPAWLSADFVRVTGDVSALPVVQPVEKPRTTEAKIMIPVGDYVWLRTAPNAKARTLQILRSRQIYAVIGSNAAQTWWQVRVGNLVGWVNTGVVAEIGDFADVPVVTP